MKPYFKAYQANDWNYYHKKKKVNYQAVRDFFKYHAIEHLKNAKTWHDFEEAKEWIDQYRESVLYYPSKPIEMQEWWEFSL